MSKVLIKWPSRERPDLFFATLKQWLVVLSGKHSVHFLFSFDAKDVMTDEAQRRKLAGIFDNHATACATMGVSNVISYQVCVGPEHRTKVQACNADIDYSNVRDWDLLIVTSDDMWPMRVGIDDSLIRASENLDVALWVYDGHRPDALVTLPVMTRSYYARFGYVYHPAYQSQFCDNEWTDVALAAGKLIGPFGNKNDVWIEHRHPLHGFKVWDRLYREELSRTLFDQDRTTYQTRKAQGVSSAPLAPPSPLPQYVGPLLTIMIPTIKERQDAFEALKAELHRQILLLPDPTLVQVIWKQDNCEVTIGDKRQALLEAARGLYVCAIDDDDLVEPTYIRDILTVILDEQRRGRVVDCVVFRGVMTVDGRFERWFDFDVEHGSYREVGNTSLRTPNHLCPIRRELAVATGFISKKQGEDSDFARRVFPRITTQAIVRDHKGDKKVLYHYRFSRSGTRTQREVDKCH